MQTNEEKDRNGWRPEEIVTKKKTQNWIRNVYNGKNELNATYR